MRINLTAEYGKYWNGVFFFFLGIFYFITVLVLFIIFREPHGWFIIFFLSISLCMLILIILFSRNNYKRGYIIIEAHRAFINSLTNKNLNAFTGYLAEYFKAEYVEIYTDMRGTGYKGERSGSVLVKEISPAEWDREFAANFLDIERIGASYYTRKTEDNPLLTEFVFPVKYGNEIIGACVLAKRKLAGFQASLFEKITEVISPTLYITIVNRKLRLSREIFKEAYRDTESRLMKTVAEVNDMITFVKDNRITYINKAGIDLLGYGDSQELLWRNPEILYLFPEDRKELLRQLKGTGKVKNFELLLKKKNGDKVYGLLSAVATIDGGEIKEVVGITKDITERMKNEEKIIKLNLELSKTNKKLKDAHLAMVQQEKLASMGQLAAGIAHEINTPLGYVKSNLNMMERYIKSQRDCLKEIIDKRGGSIQALTEKHDIDYIHKEVPVLVNETNQGIERIIRIINTLLSFTRSDTENLASSFNLNKCIDDALVIAMNELKYTAKVETFFEDLPVVIGNSGEIGQVILNILTNSNYAIKTQNRKGLGTIVIKTHSGTGEVFCEICDDGPGIPKDKQLRIFDAFYTLKPVGEGTGLGLSISYDIIVKKHRGKIEVKSEEGKGACFIISLPVKP